MNKKIFKMLITIILSFTLLMGFVQASYAEVNIELSCGTSHTLALMSNGTVKAWGRGTNGQLGNFMDTNSSYPVDVYGITNAKQVVAGEYHSLALLTDGTVKAWGASGDGQLGLGTTSGKSSPFVISGLSNVKQLAAGAKHNLALLNDGTVKVWGNNDMGQLGLGHYIDILSPTNIGLSNVKQVAAGINCSFALTNDGTVLAWGPGNWGQLGQGNALSYNTPKVVPGLTNVQKLYAKGSSIFALINDGTVKAWGFNSQGQLGIGSTIQSNSPVTVNGLTNVKDLAPGWYMTFALMNDGSVKTWGYNYYGELGIGNTTQKTTPVSLTGLSNIRELAAGPSHAFAIMNDGSIKAWGYNNYGQLGTGNTTQQTSPVPLTLNLILHSPTSLSVVNNGNKTVTATVTNQLNNPVSGVVVNFTSFNTNVATVPSNGTTGADGKVTVSITEKDVGTTTIRASVTGITPTSGHACLYTVTPVVSKLQVVNNGDNTITAVVNDNFGNPVSGVAVEFTCTDTRIATMPANGTTGADGTATVSITHQSAGTTTISATVVGISPKITHSIEYIVTVIPPREYTQLVTGTFANYSLALMNNGTVKAWGYNSHGELGIGNKNQQNSPVVVPGLTNVKQLVAGDAHSLALMNDGTVKAWGENYLGQLGIGNTNQQNSPVVIPGLTNVKQLVAGGAHSLALMNDGTVKAWGYNRYGQLGIGHFTDKTSPVVVPGLSNVKQLVAGSYHTLAIMNDGTVKAWGMNDFGQLGTGGYSTSTSPVDIPGLSNVKQLAAGVYYTLALMNDGTVKAWGDGPLGIGSATKQTSPVIVPGLKNIKQLTAGYAHAIALTNYNTAKAWGYNIYGQLGTGNATQQKYPVDVPGLFHIKQVVAGQAHTLAVMNDGTVKAWGNNTYGQLGLGNTTFQQTSPVDVPGFNIIQSIPVISISPETPTKGNVTVTIKYSDNSLIKQYKLGTTGIWTDYTAPFMVSGNDTIYARAQSSAGYWSEEVSLVITNIDKVAPVITVNLYNTSPTNQNITVTVSTNEGTLNTTSHTFTENSSFDFKATDNAGNTTTKTVTITNIDKIVPTTEPILNGPDGSDSWYKSEVKVALTATDNTGGSGISGTEYSFDGSTWTPYMVPFTVSAEGSTTVYYRSKDKAENVENNKSVVIKIDKTPPVITGTVVTQPTANGWYKNDVIIHFEATDAVSGVDTITPDTTISTEGTNQSITGTATDKAGNSASYTVNGINIDKTAPTTEPTLAGQKGINSWYTSEVKVTLTATDNAGGSGVAGTEYSFDGSTWTPYTVPFTVSAEGSTTLYYRSSDKADNLETDRTLVIKIDGTPPEITGAAKTRPNTNGWYRSNVIVGFTASDSISGVDTVTPDIEISTEGENQSVTGTATDMAGNSASFTVTNISIDKSKPQVLINVPKDGSEYSLNQNVPADWSAQDNLSGLALANGTVSSGDPIDTSTVGAKTFTVVAEDKAGNQTTSTVTYYVRYSFGGVLSPIKSDGKKDFKSGSNVPVKFQLKDAGGNNISTAAAAIYIAPVTDGSVGDKMPAAGTGSTSSDNKFRYDPTEGQYIFNLNTKSLSSGTWQIIIELDDGTVSVSNIEVK